MDEWRLVVMLNASAETDRYLHREAISRSNKSYEGETITHKQAERRMHSCIQDFFLSIFT